MLRYSNNPRRNLELYWRQYFPEYTIPAGYHVHHIKPKCAFEDKADPCIHHPRNLIALHPDDHVTIHKCRGDTWIKEKFLLSVVGRKLSEETKAKISKAQKGRSMSMEQRMQISKTTKGRPGKPCSEITKQKIREARTDQIMKPLSEETKRKIGLANSGPNGRTFSHSATTKLKMQKSNKTRIPVLIDGVNYASANAAAKTLGFAHSKIKRLNELTTQGNNYDR